MKNNRRVQRSSYALPLPPVLLLGSLLAISFYGLIFAGPLDFSLLRRYCLSHPVAVASVSLFFVGIVGLALKWFYVARQSGVTGRAAAALRRLLTDGDDVSPSKRAEWLSASWEAQPAAIRDSWFGVRIMRAIELQIARGRRHQLENDLKSLAEADADRQHDSFSLLRIIHWAMPMLGFLGTVLGISQTLGQLDTELLATQQQEAMNQLTAGLYVAFDTTAIALTLTVFSMFVQFAISRIEVNLLNRIDSESSDNLIRYLSSDPLDTQDSLLTPVRQMAAELISTVQQLVEDQSAIWARSVSESQRQWSSWTEQAASTVEQQLGSCIGQSLEKHIASMERLQDEGSRQIDMRWQQWQTTLSDQARLVQGQQKEIIRQSEILQELVGSTTDLRRLEETIHDSVSRLGNIHRIEDASMCIAEAVAALGTSLERAGVIRGVPTKPRPAKKSHSPVSAGEELQRDEKAPIVVVGDEVETRKGMFGDEPSEMPPTLPLDSKRKAA
ncbi:MAG: MotA/TolQ/ExbB proton channel family protein [Pirellulaceae bacterium]